MRRFQHKATLYGPKAGRTFQAQPKALYEGIAPDGSKLQMRSFHCDSETAQMRLTRQRRDPNGPWHAGAVREEQENWPSSSFIEAIWVEARRIK